MKFIEDSICLLYTSDAADDTPCVDLGGRRIIKKNTTPWGSSIEQLILDVIEEFDFPVLFNFPAGHETDNRALIFGKSIKMNVKPTISEVIFK